MNKNFWKAALIRAVRTVAQTALAMIPAAATIQQVNWLTVLSTAALAGVVSVLTSIATGLPEAENKGNVANAVRRYDGEQTDEEAECPVTVLAYDDYDEDGSPIVGHDFPDEGDDADCDKCDLSAYVDGGENDGGNA